METDRLQVSLPAEVHPPSSLSSLLAGGRILDHRRRWRLPGVYLVGAVLMVTAAVVGFGSHAHLTTTNAQLSSTRSELHRTLAELAVTRKHLASAVDQSTAAGQTLDTESAQLTADQKQLVGVEATVSSNGVNITTLDACLSGVQQALNLISLGNQTAAATTLRSVSSACQSTGAGTG